MSNTTRPHLAAHHVVLSIKWHFEAKNLALRNALRVRAPLSPEAQRELRLSYSEYFVHLMSAADFLLEKEMPKAEEFKQALHQTLVFSNAPDGESNFLYLRELRNSIVHRGLDITKAARFDGDFPVVVAPPRVTNPSGTKQHESFVEALLIMIRLCEATIGPAIAKHLEAIGYLEPATSQEEMERLARQTIDESTILPPWAKDGARERVGSFDYVDMQRRNAEELVRMLNTNALDQISTREPIPFFEITTWPVPKRQSAA